MSSSTDDDDHVIITVNSTMPTWTYNFTDDYNNTHGMSEADARFVFILYNVVMPILFGVITLVGIIGELIL